VRVGDIVKVSACDSMPEVVGATGEIVDMEIQQVARYTVYPVWVKITSGERASKVYGFREGEVESVVAGREAQEPSLTAAGMTTRTRVIEQLEEILKGVVTLEEIGDMERVIAEAKGKILEEPSVGFWEGKTPCWEMFRCPEAVRDECPAFKHQSLPCWEIEGTYCKLYDYGAKGDGTEICQYCRVYKRWGQGKPIELKLLGQGFNHAGRPLEKGGA